MALFKRLVIIVSLLTLWCIAAPTAGANCVTCSPYCESCCPEGWNAGCLWTPANGGYCYISCSPPAAPGDPPKQYYRICEPDEDPFWSRCEPPEGGIAFSRAGSVVRTELGHPILGIAAPDSRPAVSRHRLADSLQVER